MIVHLRQRGFREDGLRRPLHPKRRLAPRSCFFEGVLLRPWACRGRGFESHHLHLRPRLEGLKGAPE